MCSVESQHSMKKFALVFGTSGNKARQKISHGKMLWEYVLGTELRATWNKGTQLVNPLFNPKLYVKILYYTFYSVTYLLTNHLLNLYIMVSLTICPLSAHDNSVSLLPPDMPIFTRSTSSPFLHCIRSDVVPYFVFNHPLFNVSSTWLTFQYLLF